MKHYENLRKMKDGDIPDAPIGQFLGFKVVEVEQGMVVLEMDTSERLYNPMGTLHGGILCDLSDAAMGYAFASTLADDEAFTTLEIKLNFLKPIWKTKLRAVSKVIKKGTNISLLECHVYDAEKSLVAYSTSTCMILRDKMAKGREIKDK
ncbi:PaaI family thioesterase [Sporosarcina sp. E16_8]|uniref:PaaI family thioesterase n=1 Tax=Sporosarcina sp. E16_8 TaxID=2789295 RepID=UPI001A9342AD|nr:PaaI family thioesterase [Sporosarcina sp. E16_8]MBO0589440.1 PaaI family thioesterase [Sporosarcina sp. E16_8]